MAPEQVQALASELVSLVRPCGNAGFRFLGAAAEEFAEDESAAAGPTTVDAVSGAVEPLLVPSEKVAFWAGVRARSGGEVVPGTGLAEGATRAFYLVAKLGGAE